jgi:DNA-binding PadR family transcriptional regulator
VWCLCGPSELSPVQFLLLLLLSRKPAHGYELFKKINEGFGERWKLNPGAIYKTLAKLSKKGYIRQKETKDGKTVYETTADGEKALVEGLKWSADWVEFTKKCCPSCCVIEFKFETREKEKAEKAKKSNSNK